MAEQRDPGSFRDSWGHIYTANGKLLRQINLKGRSAYDSLMSSGLYEELVADGLLVRHSEVAANASKTIYKIIAPEVVPVITYPYEWSFSQLKDAALATLRIQQAALRHGMTLRDASAYNIQFIEGRPCLIDTLSFEPYQPGSPWQAYRQFCQHFLAPLALMSTRNPSLLGLLQLHLDGVPLSLAADLLPRRSRLRPGLLIHLVTHARLQRRNEATGTGATGAKAKAPSRTLSQTALAGIIDSLERMIKSLRLKNAKTEWGQYYQDTNYSDSSFTHKKTVVEDFLKTLMPERVLDLGANNGLFSRIAVAQGAFVISSDIDPLAVELNYREMKTKGETNLLPLLVDLTNPSPAIGWANRERRAFSVRVTADVVMALALIHHLAIGNNVPFELISSYFAELGPHLIIEFVPKTDTQVERLLVGREDIFSDYSEAGFERAFGTRYEIVDKVTLTSPKRTLYLMKRR